MKQTRFQSAVETAVSTAIGFVVALVATALILPAFGYPVTYGDNLGITTAFTFVSLVRGWWVRRLFNWLHHRGQGDGP